MLNETLVKHPDRSFIQNIKDERSIRESPREKQLQRACLLEMKRE